MKINKMTRDYIRLKLEDIPASDFVGQGLLKDLQSDEDWEKEREECEHEEGHFIGEKQCCVKCGSYYKKGDYMLWENKDLLK